ncbi:MAG: short chain dehydrogenase [Bdellovibrionales bacterium]|nr:short chain dehydrogenase [Bdellovibrionales bacterium]
MKIVLIGASGTIGKEVGIALSSEHEVIAVTRQSSDLRLDLESQDSIRALFENILCFDAIVCVAGNAKYGEFQTLTEDDYYIGLKNKLMGQVNLVRIALDYIRPGGVIVLTGGTASRKPFAKGGASISMVNAALEGFVRAVAEETQGKIRINLVAPGWAKETLEAFQMESEEGIPAKEMAPAYLNAIAGESTGKIFDTN